MTTNIRYVAGPRETAVRLGWDLDAVWRIYRDRPDAVLPDGRIRLDQLLGSADNVPPWPHHSAAGA